MASYRYRRDVKETPAEPPKTYATTEKTANWWHYHWKWVTAAFLLLVFVFYLVFSYVRWEKPDLVVGILSPGALPAQVGEILQAELAAHTPDLNGDGKIIVEIRSYIVPSERGDAASEMLDYTQFAGMIQLPAELEKGELSLVIAPEAYVPEYQEFYAIYTTLDGAFLTNSGTDVERMTVPLSSLSFYAQMQDANGAPFLAGYRIGVASFPKETPADHDARQAVYDVLDAWVSKDA